MTLTFRSEGGKITGKHHETGLDWSFETRPSGWKGGVQWEESGGGATSHYSVEIQGDKLALWVQTRDSTGREARDHFFLKRVSN